MGTLVIRADADPRIGSGHLMRCLALAQGWRDAGGQARLLTRCDNPALLRRFQQEDIPVRPLEAGGDPEQFLALLAEVEEPWAVLDGYHFDAPYQRRVKEAGYRLLWMDDTCALPHYYADIVLNQDLGAEELRYAGEPFTRLLLGSRYALLRREFLGWKSWRRQIPEVGSKLLVTLGGADPENFTARVLEALGRLDLPGLEAAVVVGASNPREQELRDAARRLGPRVRLVQDAADMPQLMAWADAAVAAAGGTRWEMALLGLPALVTILAENQSRSAQQLQRHGGAINLGWHQQVTSEALAAALAQLLRDPAARASMAEAGRRAVDGEGARRVVSCMQTFPSEPV